MNNLRGLIRAPGGCVVIGVYRVFLVAIDCFVYQVVVITQRCIQIMSGKRDQMRPKESIMFCCVQRIMIIFES